MSALPIVLSFLANSQKCAVNPAEPVTRVRASITTTKDILTRKTINYGTRHAKLYYLTPLGPSMPIPRALVEQDIETYEHDQGDSSNNGGSRRGP
ncbi:unnamed protein product [Prunus armeniaca]